MDNANTSSDIPPKPQITELSIEEKNKRLEQSSQLLLRRDLDLREINDELENEKLIISEEKEKLEIILSAIYDAVIALDVNKKIIIFSKSAESLLGCNRDEVLNKPIDQFVTFIDNNVAINIFDLIEESQSTKKSISKKDVKIVCKDKSVSVDLFLGYIKDAHSTDLGYIISLHDITEINKLEEMKLDFVSMAAHELRSPLTAINGYLSVFIHENENNFNEEHTQFLNRIMSASQRLAVLVESLLSVSRIEQNAFTINPAFIDWTAAVKQIVEEFANRAKERNIELVFEQPAEQLPEVYVDRLRMMEVVTNLLTNAISYTHEGGRVTISLEQKENTVITHIQDNGEGIPKESMEQLFTKFFRIAGKLAQGSKGTGLGLYISKAIVEMHHGNIWVESDFGKGSTFSFSLPTQKP